MSDHLRVTKSADPRVEAARRVCPGSPLDLGVARWVEILHNKGVETYESCQGGPGHAYPEPTVRFHGTPAAGWHALGVCQDHGIPVRSLARLWSLDYNAEPTGPYWQIVFSRMDEGDHV